MSFMGTPGELTAVSPAISFQRKTARMLLAYTSSQCVARWHLDRGLYPGFYSQLKTALQLYNHKHYTLRAAQKSNLVFRC